MIRAHHDAGRPNAGPRGVGTSAAALATALVIAVAVSACGGPQERKAQYRARAQDYMQAGNFPKARVALRNVLKIDPKDADAYFLFAQVEEKEKNWRNAVANYQQVVELVPDHKDALITLAKYYLEARLSDEVSRSAEKVLAKDPRDPQAQALKIALLAQENRIVQALAQAESLFRLHPNEPDVVILLATLYSHQQRPQDAAKILRHALESNPHHLDLLHNLKTVLTAAHDDHGVEHILRRIIDEEPSVFDHRLDLARLYGRQADDDRAEAVLRDATMRFIDHDQPWLALAAFLDLKKGMPAAEAALQEAKQQRPYSTKIDSALAELYVRHRVEAKARKIYESLSSKYGKKPVGLEAGVMLAQLDFAGGRHEEAESRLADVLKENPRSAEGLTLQGKIALSKRNGKDAVQAFRTVLRDQPEQAHIQSLLGDAHLLNGDTQLARESFERAVSLQPGLVDASVALALLDGQQGRLEPARARLRGVVAAHRDHFPAVELLFALDLQAGDWIRAKTTLTHLRSIVGEGAVLFMAEGKLYEAQRDFSKAEAAFEQASAASPDAPEPLIALIRLETAQQHTGRAQRRLEHVLALHPHHRYGHGLLAEVLLLSNRREDAAAQFREATRVNPTWATPWISWAGLSVQQGRHDDAVRILTQAIAVNPTNEELHLMLASLLSGQGHIDAAISTYESVLRLNPRNVFAANNLAAVLTDHKGDVSSLERAFSLSRDFEKSTPHPLFLDTLGWVRFKMGHRDQALRLLKAATSGAPDMPMLNYHLGSALYQSGRKVEAGVYLSKALKSSDMFPGRRDAEQLLALTNG